MFLTFVGGLVLYFAIGLVLARIIMGPEPDPKFRHTYWYHDWHAEATMWVLIWPVCLIAYQMFFVGTAVWDMVDTVARKIEKCLNLRQEDR